MGSEEAFTAIRRALGANKRVRLTKSIYDDESFGNFVISFQHAGKARSIVLDRGELILCSDPDGDGESKTLLSSIYEVDEQAILRALQIEF